MKRRQGKKSMAKTAKNCQNEKVYLVETVPLGLSFKCQDYLPNIGKELIEMIQRAKTTICIASIYLTLLNDSKEPVDGDDIGRSIYEEIVAAAQRGVKIRIVLTVISSVFSQTEALKLQKNYPDNISIAFLDLQTILYHETGIQHTKLLLVDGSSFYVGSANFDWRSYSHVAEIGIVGKDSPAASQDILKIFEIYWYLGFDKCPALEPWPDKFSTQYNKGNPLMIGNPPFPVFFSVTPSEFVAPGRLRDVYAVLDVINNTREGTIRMCAMEFSCYSLIKQKHYMFWSKLDYALRRATIERKVEVRMLVDSSRMLNYRMKHTLESLHEYGKILVKTVTFPKYKVDIPFARLFHSKLCIGGGNAWIGTNNFTPTYYYDSAGIGCNIHGTTPAGESLVNSLIHVFDRYYDSDYATFIKLW